MILIGFQYQGLVCVHLRPQGSGDILRAIHKLTALIIQAQNTGISLPCLSTTPCEGGTHILCQKAVTVSFGNNSSRNEGLLFHSRLGTNGNDHIVQVPDFIPLIGCECYRILDRTPIPYACLDLKCLLKLGR